MSKGQKQIQSGFETYGVKDYVVIQKGDTKIAVTGAFGKDSLKCAPTCELLFKDPVEAVKDTVEKIKKNEEVDMIVCVSHCGTWEDGNPIENLEDHIIKEDGKELKAWDAIARYMRSFDDTDSDGIANVSKYYASTHDHKVVDDSKDIIDLIKKLNKFGAMIVTIILVIILLIVLLILLIRRIIRKLRNKNR